MGKEIKASKAVVAHSVGRWLPLTMTWFYNQLKYMEDVESIVLANRVQNREHFPWEWVYALRGRFPWLVYLSLRKLGLVHYPSIFDKAIRTHRPSILHSHFGNRGWYDRAIVRNYGLKHVVTFYGHDVNRLPTVDPSWHGRYEQLFAAADLFLCEGPYMAQTLVEMGCPSGKVKIQRLGVELGRIPYLPRHIDADGLTRILIAGTFREKKGIPYALEAIGQIRSRYPNLRVTVFGDSTGHPREEKEKKRIQEVAHRYNLDPVTTWLGFQPHEVLMTHAYRHHIFLSPSVTSSDGDTEGGAPVTIIEMSASGMPVVSTRHCDIPQVIEHGVSGFLAAERDVEELAHYLGMLLENPAQWYTMGIAGRKHVEAHFDVRAQARALTELYETVYQS